MKKLLFILCILFSLGASAQTMVYDTTIVKSPLTVVTTGAKDSLILPQATTSQAGFMTAAAMQQLTALVGGSPVFPTSNIRTETVYTVQASDFNKLIVMTNTGVTTVVLPASLGDGFTCKISQQGGQVTIAAATGVTIKSKFNYRRIQTTNGVAVVNAQASSVYVLSGDIKQ